MGILDRQQKVTYDPTSEEVVVRKKTGNRLRAPFSAVAPFTNKKRRHGMSPDVFDLLEKVSKGAFTVFNNLKYNRDEKNNVTQFTPTEELSKTDKEVLSRRLKELKDVGLLRRVSKHVQCEGNRSFTFKDPRNTYVINPEVLRCSDHDEAEHLWNNCK